MKQRIIVAVIALPFVFLALVYFPVFILTGAVSLVCILMAYELLNAVMPFKSNKKHFIYTILAAAVIPIGTYFDINHFLFPAILLALMSLIFLEAIVRFNTENHHPIIYVFVALFGGIIIPYLLSTVLNLRLMEHGRYLVLIPVICAFVTDAGAYFVGVLFGKHKAFPKVSPKKTIEGCVGGIVIGTLSMVLYGVYLINFSAVGDVNFIILIIYGLAGSIICELGDLAFSLIKREFNVKDYGQLLPGHGGALDRFDSMVFTAPIIYLLVLILPVF